MATLNNDSKLQWTSHSDSEEEYIDHVTKNDISNKLHAQSASGNTSNIELSKAVKKQIINSLTNANRLTIVVGGTGCGKSTLVPQLLLDHFGGPILCTQPRRLAVVAVSRHVAQQRNNSILGEEVGYHVGQNRVANNKTQLLFATAGIFLEELKCQGLEAILQYRVILIDECHERSSESDLCLVLIKSIMTKHPNAPNIRIILMSATFNQGRYVSYFENVPGCEYIDAISIESAQSINAFYKQVQTSYLENILQKIYSHRGDGIPNLLETKLQLRKFERNMRLDPDSELTGQDAKSLPTSMLALILTLVRILHQEEPNNTKFLIFAPTYRHLEQIYSILSEVSLPKGSIPCRIHVDVLHSSIDMEDCLVSMKDTSNYDTTRHILLASAIADSSVTIPGVTCVIDTCRALEVRWDAKKEVNDAKTVWASKSICDQRRGRTGRTCAGRVFRLLHQSFYINRLDNWDQPQIELASCREEMLALLSASASKNNKMLSNPVAVLKRCLDPPPDLSMEKAMKYLVDIGACSFQKNGSSQKEIIIPTDIGRILAALPFKVSDASMIVKGAQNSMLHEALVLTSILNTRPYPIVHRFGKKEFNENIQAIFYENVNAKDKKTIAVANFSAYLFWYIHWKMKIWHKLAKARFLFCTGDNGGNDAFSKHKYNSYPSQVREKDRNAYDCNVWEWTSETADSHTRWCKERGINPTSVRAIDTEVAVTLKILYHKDHEPDWLRYQTSSPHWVKRKFLAEQEEIYPSNIFNAVYGYNKGDEMIQKLLRLQDPSSSICTKVPEVKEKQACIHFLNGNCKYGESCRNAHSYTAPRPLCRFFLNGGCTTPYCIYSHSIEHKKINLNLASLGTDKPVYALYDGGPLAWFENNAEKLLIFGEGDFSFTQALASLQIHPFQSTSLVDTEPYSLGGKYCTLSNIDATRCHTNKYLKSMSRNITKFSWNFPFTGKEEDDEIHKSLMNGTFLSVAAFFESNLEGANRKAEFALTLQGDQLSRWSVLQSAERAGFFLNWWEEFDIYEFPGYFPQRANGVTFPAQHARFYVFRLAKA